MIKINENELALQTEEGVEIIEIYTGNRKKIISHKRKDHSQELLMQTIPLNNEHRFAIWRDLEAVYLVNFEKNTLTPIIKTRFL